MVVGTSVHFSTVAMDAVTVTDLGQSLARLTLSFSVKQLTYKTAAVMFLLEYEQFPVVSEPPCQKVIRRCRYDSNNMINADIFLL